MQAAPSYSMRRALDEVATRTLFAAADRLGGVWRPSGGGPDIERIEGVVWRRVDERSLKLDVHRPLSRRGPALLHIHGGGFRSLSRRTHGLLADAYARLGFVVFNIDYRLAPEHRFPDPLIDCCEAWRWVTERGGEFGASAAGAAIAGESAGANLALGVVRATCFESDFDWAHRAFDSGAPSRVLLASPLGRLTEAPQRLAQGGASRSDWGFDALARRVAASEVAAARRAYVGERRPPAAWTEPARALSSSGPPTRPLPSLHCLIARRDPIARDGVDIAREWDAVGGSVRLDVFDGGHSFHAFQWTQTARRAWDAVADWLEGEQRLEAAA